MHTTEVNFDGLVGLTHNYTGLSPGNRAAILHAGETSKPKKAALQGLAKMKALHDMGWVQGVLPPQERPDLHTLRQLGFSGSNSQVISQAARLAPELLAACSSASSMWTANAATVSPSADSLDGKVHFTPANLCSMFHRTLEHQSSYQILKAVFSDPNHFVHHQALPGHVRFGDEGAANHTRFCVHYGDAGVQLFVYGQNQFSNDQIAPRKYPARQTFEACQAISRLHLLNEQKVIYAQQNPVVIDQGVFHNDVIAVGNRNLLFCHKQAWLNQEKVYQDIRSALSNVPFHLIEVSDKDISVQQAVSTYLFNSQILSLDDDNMMLIVPSECQQEPAVWQYLEHLLSADNPINQIKVFDLRQSMKNGGGPACLRLRVALTQQEIDTISPSCLMNEDLYQKLEQWINTHYRDELTPSELATPDLYDESRTALDELTQILDLGSIYSFQQMPG